MNFNQWAKNIRDPSNKLNEGKRTIEIGSAKAFYEIAEVEFGWTWRVELYVKNCCGVSTPWRIGGAERANALNEIIKLLQKEFSRIANEREGKPAEDAKLILNLFRKDDLFGFIEPKPQSVKLVD